MSRKQSENPAISVIIPAYNRPQLVIDAARSVLAQTCSDYELIIVDDGSVPRLELPKSLTEIDQLNIIHLDKNSGAAAARNTGARAARGKWLAWLDSDDTWSPDKLEKQLVWLEKQGREGENIALATGFEYLHSSGQRDPRMPVPASDPQLFFAGCWFCPGSTIMLSKALFERVGPYDVKMPRLEDMDWFARMALAGGRLEVLDGQFATIVVGQKPARQTVIEAGNYMLEKYGRTRQPLPAGTMKILAAYLQVEYAASAIKGERNYAAGLLHLAKSWLARPRLRLHLHDFWQ